MTIANFSVTGYTNTKALPELQGSIEGLLYWYEGLANWASLSEVLLLPKDTALHLAGMWRNGGAEPISGHLEIVITRPDGSQLTLNDVLNQNNWAAPGNGWKVQFEPVVLDHAGTYKATVRLSTMGQLLDETTVDVANALTALSYQILQASIGYIPGLLWLQPVFSCQITNPGPPGTWIVSFQLLWIGHYSGRGLQTIESFRLTLGAGQTYLYTFDNTKPGGYYKVAIDRDAIAQIWLEDDAGGKSDVTTISGPYGY